MTMFAVGFFLCLFIFFIFIGIYITQSRKLKKSELLKEKLKAENCAEVYEREIKESEKIINNLNPDNMANELQDLATRANNRRSKKN